MTDSSRCVSDITRFALKQMHGLDAGDLADGAKDVSTVHRGAPSKAPGNSDHALPHSSVRAGPLIVTQHRNPLPTQVAVVGCR